MCTDFVATGTTVPSQAMAQQYATVLSVLADLESVTEGLVVL